MSAHEDSRYPARVHNVDQRIAINQHKVSDLSALAGTAKMKDAGVVRRYDPANCCHAEK
jgi:hypothetical protein